jgi:hypothetical protein
MLSGKAVRLQEQTPVYRTCVLLVRPASPSRPSSKGDLPVATVSPNELNAVYRFIIQ